MLALGMTHDDDKTPATTFYARTKRQPQPSGPSPLPRRVQPSRPVQPVRTARPVAPAQGSLRATTLMDSPEPEQTSIESGELVRRAIIHSYAARERRKAEIAQLTQRRKYKLNEGTLATVALIGIAAVLGTLILLVLRIRGVISW